jgi:hypothetical protein
LAKAHLEQFMKAGICVFFFLPIFMSLFHNPFSGTTESTHRQLFFHLTLLSWELSGCSDFGLVCMCKTGMMVAFLL